MLLTWASQSGNANPVNGLDFIHLAAGQSNEVGWGTGQTNGISYALDPQDSKNQELTLGFGPNFVLNGDFGDGTTTGWAFTSGASGAVVNGQMVVTKIGAGFNTATYTIAGLTIGVTYEIWVKASSTAAAAQFQITTSGAGASVRSVAGPFANRYLKKRITATAASHNLVFLFSLDTEANGATYTVDDVNYRAVESPGLYNRIAIEPMEWPDWVNVASYGTSPAFHFAKELIRQGAASVKTIAAAVGGTRLYTGGWQVGGTQYLYALAQLTAAVAAYPSAQVILSWIQGEADGSGGTTAAQYKQAFKDMVAGFRAVAPNLKVVIGSMVPEYIAANAPVGVIDTAQKELPAEMSRVQFTSMISGYQIPTDLPHYTAPGDRLIGKRMGENYAHLALSAS